MTNLHDVNFGVNQYCGPAVLSVLTGENTDRCAAVISAVSGKKVIKATEMAHLKEALKRLRFDVEETNLNGSTLYGVLFRMREQSGLYVVLVPQHLIAVEVSGQDIYICDGHSKKPIDANQSARLLQKVNTVWRVTPGEVPKFLREEISVEKIEFKVYLYRKSIYKRESDNLTDALGWFKFRDDIELEKIIRMLKRRFIDDND